ncbi:MAG: hypothetical protein ABW092_18225 [Candidatus Thiodiazotropha sp.]
MKILVEKGFNAIVFALLFITIAFVLDTLTPAKPTELLVMYGTHVQVLWFIAMSFAIIGGVLVLIGIGSRLGMLVGVSELLKSHYITLGFIINGLGFICIIYFLSQYVVFSW